LDEQIGRAARHEDASSASSRPWGAANKGHASLIQVEGAMLAVRRLDFVNPKQFGHRDFQKYPRTLESDRALARSLGVDYLFAPPAEEI